MSRCFPFPPPGYERKLDDTDLLKKERSKEKKHKKDKKDREKRDGKERREEKKHKEKKDKHREKKKDKEKRVDPLVESQNGDPLRQNNEHNKQDCSLGHKKSSVQPQNGEHKEYAHSWGQNEKMLVNRIRTEDIDNSKFVQELGRRIREEGKGPGTPQYPVESRKSIVDRGEILKMDGQVINKKSTFDQMSMVQNTTNGKKTRERVNEKSELTKAEGDKSKYMKNGATMGSFNNLSTSTTPNVVQQSGSEVKKRKDTEINGFYHEKEPWPNKMARPASGIFTENGRKQDYLQTPGLGQPGKSTMVDTKEQKVNGTIASQPMSPISKKPSIATANHILVKPTSTSSPPVNTGHIPSQPLPVPTTRPPSSAPNHFTNKPLSIPSTKPPQPMLNSKKKESIRPPHPDSKYLKQILAVPVLDPWSGLDSQDWLFSSKDHPHFKKAGNSLLQDNKEVEVWSEAKQLKSVDVCALPYVIPY